MPEEVCLFPLPIKGLSLNRICSDACKQQFFSDIRIIPLTPAMILSQSPFWIHQLLWNTVGTGAKDSGCSWGRQSVNGSRGSYGTKRVSVLLGSPIVAFCTSREPKKEVWRLSWHLNLNIEPFVENICLLCFSPRFSIIYNFTAVFFILYFQILPPTCMTFTFSIFFQTVSLQFFACILMQQELRFFHLCT